MVVGADGEFESVEDDGTGSLADDIKLSRTAIRYNQAKGTYKSGQLMEFRKSQILAIGPYVLSP